MSGELFTEKMRMATFKIHSISDALTRTKLLFALNDNKVWAEGLLIFYEIFKFLETSVKEKKEENLGKLYMPEMDRTQAFEEDLTYYLGHGWKKNYQMRDSVKEYVDYLKKLLETDSDLLMAYYYHLYMGLLFGGQIIRMKRQLKSRLIKSQSNGEAVTDFGNQNLSDLKTKLKDKMNSIAEELDDEKKAQLLEESVKVFELNNSVLGTLKDTNSTAFLNFNIYSVSVGIICVFILYCMKLFWDNKFSKSL